VEIEPIAEKSRRRADEQRRSDHLLRPKRNGRNPSQTAARGRHARGGVHPRSSAARLKMTQMSAPARKVPLEDIPVRPGMTKECVAPKFFWLLLRRPSSAFPSSSLTVSSPSSFHPQRGGGAVRPEGLHEERAQRHPAGPVLQLPSVSSRAL
jgi:hypothetical protein